MFDSIRGYYLKNSGKSVEFLKTVARLTEARYIRTGTGSGTPLAVANAKSGSRGIR